MNARRRASTLLSALLVLAAAAAGATSRDWPQHRGPEQTGRVSGTGAFEGPELGLQVAWRKPLGSGYSGIAVVGDVLVTMTAAGQDDVVVALDAASGAERWRYRLAEMYAGHDGSDDGPISTPTVHEGVVYALGPRGQLAALRLADGTELWKKAFDGEKDSRTPSYGYSTSPVIAGDAVIVLTGGPADRSITAFRAGDGAILWSFGDDSVSYQTPLLTDLGGRRQLVAATNHLLVGLDPATGARLWEHRHTAENGDGFFQPVPLGDDAFLLSFFNEAVAYRVSREGETYKVEEKWRSNELRNSYGIPVLHDGLLYGWSGRFVSAIDPATGTSVWKSRPPGGHNLTVVDGHLLISGNDGDLVVARASAAGYEERARLPLFEVASWTAASFAANRIFVRDLAEIAAIDVTATRAPAQVAAAEPDPMDLPPGFSAFLAAAEKAADDAARKVLVDEYLAAQKSFPVIEDGGHVVFLYRGEAKDLAVAGNAVGFTDELPMRRLAGTDLYYAARKLDPEAHYEYRFNVDFGNLVPDPKNPHVIATFGGQTTELRMPGWQAPDHVGEPTGPRGRIDTFSFHSTIRDNDRDLRVYLPPGYDGGSERYPVLLVNNGPVAIDQEQIDRTLDNLIGKTIRPVVVVFLPRVGPEYGPAVADYARVMAEEIVPELEKRYRLEGGARNRAVTGVGSGAFASAFAAFAAPGTFGKLAVQSFYNTTETDLLQRIAGGAEKDLVLYVELSRNDYDFQPNGPRAAPDSRALVDALRAKGHTVVVNEVAGAPSAGHWRAQNDDILELFFPLEG